MLSEGGAVLWEEEGPVRVWPREAPPPVHPDATCCRAASVPLSGRGSGVALPTAHPGEVCSNPRHPGATPGEVFCFLCRVRAAPCHFMCHISLTLGSSYCSGLGSDPHQTRTVAPTSCSLCLFPHFSPLEGISHAAKATRAFNWLWPSFMISPRAPKSRHTYHP